MKHLNEYIAEKLRINSEIKTHEYTVKPKTKDELSKIIIKRFKESNLNDFKDFNDIDVTNIKDMSILFSNLDCGNIDISEWNVSNVEKMDGMFFNCKNVKCDISGWDV